MDVIKHDGIMLLYNFAAVLSGGYAVFTMGITDRWVMIGIAFSFAVVWTVYFKFAMVERFSDHPQLVTDTDQATQAE
ncbi:hypothetical protein ACLI4Z_10990 [Natrialbaceae archaeon A-arb3/5]